MSALFAWLEQSGAALEGVKAVSAGDGLGLGLVASKAAKAGETLAEVPRCCQLTWREDAALTELCETVPDNAWLPSTHGRQAGLLALQLLRERALGGDSFFQPYIESLPEVFAGMPLFYGTAAAFDELQSPVSIAAKQRCATLHRMAMGPLAGPQPALMGQTADLNALGWCFASVSSRAFRVNDGDAAPSLVPIMDLANHAIDPNVRVVAGPDGCVRLVAKADFEEGDELLNSYDYGEPLSNDFLLLDYGFVIEDNPHERVALRFDLGFVKATLENNGMSGALKLPLKAWQVKTLAQLRLGDDIGESREVMLGGPTLVDMRMVNALRVLFASSEREGVGPATLGGPGSSPSEVFTLCCLANICTEILARYPTSLCDDEALLAEGHCSADTRTAVVYRATKKRLLHATQQSLRELLKEAEANASAATPKKGFGGTKKKKARRKPRGF